MRKKTENKDSVLIEQKDFSKWLLVKKKDVEGLIKGAEKKLDESGVRLLTVIYEWLEDKNKLPKS